MSFDERTRLEKRGVGRSKTATFAMSEALALTERATKFRTVADAEAVGMKGGDDDEVAEVGVNE